MAYQHAKQNEDSKTDHQIGEVNDRKNLVVSDITKNVNEKMFNHGFDSFSIIIVFSGIKLVEPFVSVSFSYFPLSFLICLD
jgi:hypothetical protein